MEPLEPRFMLAGGLAGDVDGDFLVTAYDAQKLATAVRTRRLGPIQQANSDLNADGRIDKVDLQLLRGVLRAGGKAQTSALVVGLHPDSDPDRDGSTTRSTVLVIGRTTGRAQVMVDAGGDGSFERKIKAGRDGRFQLTIDVALGSNLVQLRTQRSARKFITSTLRVERVEPDTQAPAVAYESPAAGLVTSRNVAIAGRATDAGSGVASLRARLDSTPFAPLAFDASGRFSLSTSLPLDGSADGPHTLQVVATDRAGNSSGAVGLTFMLDTIAPALTSFGLDPASDSAPVGDGQTALRSVSLAGLTEPLAAVALVEIGAATTADAAGRFAFSGVPLPTGPNRFTARATDAAGNARESSITIIGLADPAPVVSAGLANDTGPGGTPNADGLTSDPTITGRLVTSAPIASLRAGFQGTPEASYADILARVQPGGGFSLDRAELEAIRGGPLPDGAYALQLVAEDAAGRRSRASVAFRLDTAAPSPTIDLAPESDTAPAGDRSTTSGIVTLAGHSEPGASIAIASLGVSMRADAAGGFRIPGISLNLGGTSFAVRAEDLAGNVSVATTSFILAPREDDLVLAEGTSLAAERVERIALGQDAGARTVSFEVLADFDEGGSGSSSLNRDTFLVSLVDPADRSRTLLDRGTAGTALFALTAAGADLTPGVVRFDGRVVSIDLTSLGGAREGDLVFQLLGDGPAESRVAIRGLANTVDPDGSAQPALPPLADPDAVGGSLDLSGLIQAVGVSFSVSNVRFDPASGRYAAELVARNDGGETLGRRMAVVFPGLPAGVTLVSPSGLDATGNPYLNLSGAIPPGGLRPGSESSPVLIQIDDPAAVRFSLAPRLLVGEPNRAPVLPAQPALSVMPGRTLEVRLSSSDPDGDAVRLSIDSDGPLPTLSLTADGRLTVAPTLAQIGHYAFTVRAWDGAAETALPIALDVVADPVTTTRISGRVLDTLGRPLADLPVELGRFQTRTDADGRFVVELPATSQLTSDMDIVIPQGDVHFDPYDTGLQTIQLRRAVFDTATGTDAGNPRQQINQATSFLDASVIYGSDEARARALRTLDGTGRLKTSPGDLLPFDDSTTFPAGPLPVDNEGINPASSMFVAGDVRASENVQLAALHALFVREHNRLADRYHAENPGWDDETTYQSARKMVGAMLQFITYNEFIPALLGADALPAYSGYRADVDPRVSAMFSTAAFRVGHTLLTPDAPRLDAEGNSLPGGSLSLRESFFNTQPLVEDGLEPYLRGMVAQRAESIDTRVIDEVRNFLFGPPGSGGMDLPSMNIQRGRDLGLPDYNTARADFGLPRVASFAEITSDPALQVALRATYGTVDRIDPWVGGLAEDHLPGAAVGPFFAAVMRDQFTRTRDGDRFWFEYGQFSGPELAEIRATTLSALITRNSDIVGLPANVFTAGTPVSGPAPAGTAGTATEWRTFDGAGNNPDGQGLGRTGDHLLRNFTSAYADGIAEPSGGDRPNPRTVSNTVNARTGSIANPDGLTTMFTIWGQFLDHDLSLTPGGTTDTIEFHGEGVSGEGRYPFVAEKLPLLLGGPVIAGVDNAIARPIYLPALNAGSTVNPAAATTISQQLRPGEAEARVSFQAGTLQTRTGALYSGKLSITEVPRDRTPAALPANLSPDAVVSIQPAEMVFSQPALLTMPNRSSLSPGIMLDLWSINPVTGVFDVVGQGRVTDDGRSIETISGGIRNSSWHFFVFAMDPKDLELGEDPHNQDTLCSTCSAYGEGASEVELHSGDLVETHALTPYQSLGATQGLMLHYDTGRLAENRSFFFRYPDLGGEGRAIATGSGNVETRLEVSIRVHGDRGQTSSSFEEVLASAVQGSVDAKSAVVPGFGRPFGRFITAYIASLPTGYYTADLTSGVYTYLDGERRAGSAQTKSWSFVNVNSRTSVFGAGWNIAGLQELVVTGDGSVVLVDGGGSQMVFASLGGGAFDSPPGDFSTLRRLGDGSYRRTLTDGTVYEFTAGGLLASVTDRLGNATTYRYDASRRLTSITDPVGLETRFTYDGRYVSRITDPAGRVTLLEHTAAGDLTRITDPDGTSRQFSYDLIHRMTGEIDKRGFAETEVYENGRVVKTIRGDGTAVQFLPAQARSNVGDPTAYVTDPNGNVTVYRLDQAGQTVTVRDGGGPISTTTRDANNRITQTTDGRGNSTSYEYDARGNVIATESHGFLVSDGFATDYANGDLAGQAGGEGLGGAWRNGLGGAATDRAASAGLTYPGVASQPGGVRADGTAGTTKVSRDAGLPSDGTLYVGFLMDLETVSSGDAGTATGLWLGDGAESTPEKLLVGRTYTSTPQFSLTARDDGQPFSLANQSVAIAFGAGSTDGALDASFGGSGIVRTSFGNSGFDDERISTVLVQPDGKILAVGSGLGSSGRIGFIARYNPDGSLDPSFSGDGLASFSTPSLNIQAATLQADGKIVVVGNRFEIARMNPDGTMDTTFGGGDGWASLSLHTFQSSYSVAVQPDGKILVGGEVNSGNPNPDLALARCNPDGTLDTTFGGGDGIVTTNTGGYPGESVRKILIQSDGKIVAVALGGPNGFAVVRYGSDGALDASFGSGGIVRTNVSGNALQADAALDGVIQPDGKIVVAGSASISGTNRMALVRYNPDGSLDATFGTGGKVTSTAMPAAATVALLPDGKILVGGAKESKFALARFLDNGTIDATFGVGGVLTTDIPGATPDAAASLALQGDGKAILGGYTGSRGDFAMARYGFSQTPPIAAGSTHHLVVRIDFDAGGVNAVTGGLNDRIRLYVDPVPGFEPGAPDAEITDRDIGTLDLVGFLAQRDCALFDELRMGTTFAEVFDVAANGPDRQFVAREVVSAAAGPAATAIGDVTGDGLPDLIVADRTGKTVSIRAGDGRGGFGSSRDMAAPGGPAAIALADLDGDSRLDLVTANVDAGTVTVWLAAPAGGFRPSVSYATAARPDWVEIGDMNRDGRPDLVVLAGSGVVTVLLNDGQGGFLPRIDRGLSGILQASATIGGQLALGDLDRDGNLDVVLGTSLNGQVVRLFGDGTGHFPTTSTLAVDGRPDGVAIADIDGDGNLDLAVGRRSAASVAVFLGDGTGAFPVRRDFDAGRDPARVRFLDVNGDGWLDLVHTNATDATFSVRLGDGVGGFGARTDHAAGFQPAAIAAADLDGDGDRDLVIASIVGRVVVLGNQAAAPDAGSQLAGPFRSTFTYDPKFSQVNSMTDALGRRTILDVDPATGNTRSITAIVGLPDATSGETDDLVTRFTYTSRGLVDTVTDPLGRITDFDYDALGRLTRVTYAAGTPDQASQTFAYDAAGNATVVTDENGHRTTFEYDAMNRVTRIIEADPDGAGPLAPPVSTFAYDAAGNVVRTTDAQGHVTVAAYDARNHAIRVTDEQGNTSRMSYDAVGNLILAIDPLGHASRTVYDARNRPIATIDPDGGSTRFRYDAANNVTRVTDPVGNATLFTYDFRDRQILEVDPLGKETHYAYDAVDNLTRKTDRLGRVTEFAYDDLDRLTTETWRNADTTIANQIDYAYDRAGNLTSVVDAHSALAYTYDARDRVRTVDNAGTPGAPRVVLIYAYDGVGNVLSVTDTIDGSPGATTAYTYDALNRTVRITQSGANVSEKRVDFAYNALGQYASIARYADLAGTQSVVTTRYQYDALNRLIDLRHSNSAGDIAFYEYTYDASSRIASIRDVDGLTTYTYDDRDQLTGADRAAGDIRGDESYEYDANGNRVASSVHGTGYVTGPGNRLLSDGTYDYVYDDEGNMVRRTEMATGDYREFTWDFRNRLVMVTDFSTGGIITQQVRFEYDAFDRRIVKSVDLDGAGVETKNITYFHYDRGDVLLDFMDNDGAGPSTGIVDQRYLYGSGVDQTLAQESSGNVGWTLTDHLGTIHDVWNSSTSSNHVEYDSFGTILDQTGSSVRSRHLLTGREYDPETSLYYYRARYYDPKAGRFVGEDPVGLRAGDANLYRYVYNSPLTMIDPTGESGATANAWVAYKSSKLFLTLYKGYSAMLDYRSVYQLHELNVGRIHYLGDLASQRTLERMYLQAWQKSRVIDQSRLYRIADSKILKASGYLETAFKAYSFYDVLTSDCSQLEDKIQSAADLAANLTGYLGPVGKAFSGGYSLGRAIDKATGASNRLADYAAFGEGGDYTLVPWKAQWWPF
ncbi:peroxidase family protein [Aquisphaera insulae]|uniref:peroxidase family protein n=1 Tax=Aquisphaera insulae TaxID=2712864 RepID=UPI0013EC89F4|nr:peroxidase family protein [Aquisphaera insulae]